MPEGSNAAMQAFVSAQKANARRRYDRKVNMDLSRQNSQQLFKRNITAVLNQCFDETRCEMQRQQEAAHEGGVVKAWLPQLLAEYEGLIDDLIDYALNKHRSSCALSNFPEEHNPSRDYLAEVLSQVSRDWSAFVSHMRTLLAA